ncbi:DUF1129 family protein [Lactobacillus sp.]|uniref:DUF1129 family protein n=1 Tax=Lactobacillus sp. TaxID=1591 RepID=UPI003EF8A24C
MNAREKNKKISSKRQQKLHRAGEEENNFEHLQRLSSAQLISKLTKKNLAYFNTLQKALEDKGLNDADAQSKSEKLLAEIVSAQDQGETAKGLYHMSPTEKAEDLLKPVKKVVKPQKWQYFTVASLAFLGIFSLLAGVYELTESGNLNQAKQIGWLTILTLSLIMGYIVARYKELVAAKIQRSHLTLWSIVCLLVVLAWIWFIQSANWAKINVYLPAAIYLVVTVISVALLIPLMRKFQISHIFFGDRVKQK